MPPPRPAAAPTLGPAPRIAAGVWTPNLDGRGNILVSDFEQLPLYGWVQAQTNTLDDVVPLPRYPTQQGNADGSRSIVNAWCGAAYDYQNQVMYLSGGGHADSHICENGIYALSADTLRFSIARARSPMSAGQWYDAVNRRFVAVTGPTDPKNGSANTCMTDGTSGATHTFDALEWIPPAVAGNSKGALLMFTGSKEILNLDTQQYDTSHFDGELLTDLSYKIVVMDGWNAIHARADFYYRLWDFAPATRTSTLWSNDSRGRYIKQFDAGARIVYNHKMLVRMPNRREFVVLSAPGGTPIHVRARYGQAFDSGNRRSWGAFHDSISLNSLDGSHMIFSDPENWRDQDPDTALFAAGGTYDHWGNCIWVQTNLQGGALYKISGLDSNSWTTQRVTGAAAISTSRNGTYHRCQLLTKGASRCLMRVSSTTGNPEVCRVA